MFALFLAIAHGAVCSDAPLEELERTMADVLEANANIDEAAFASSSKLMDAAITCLDTVPPPTTLARIHHTMALRAFVDGRTRGARRSLTAIRGVDPSWKPPFPEGHPFTELWASATDPGPEQPVGSIRPKVWLVDSDVATAIPTERSFLLQVRDERGAIQYSRYLFDASDLPDFGQDRVVDPNQVPWTVSLRALGTGRVFGQGQQVDAGAIDEQSASTFGPAGELAARLTPSARFGVEATLSLLADDDVVAATSSPLGVEGTVLGLLGGHIADVGAQKAFVAARAGVMTDTVRAWPRAGNGVEPSAWRLWGPQLGVETGLRGERSQLDLAVDGALAGLTPWRADLRLGGTALLTDALGLRLQALGRTAGQKLVDGDADAGRVSERELRLSAGIDLVF